MPRGFRYGFDYTQVFAAYVFRYHRLAPELHPGKAYDVLLWVSIVAIVGVGVRSVAGLL